jgi:hypothetical protein
MEEIGAQQQSNAIEFRPLLGTSKSTPAGTQVTFYFRNRSNRVVALPGYFGSPPTAGVFQPAFIQYEIREDDKWRPLDVAYDGLPEYSRVEPGAELRLLVVLGPIETKKIAKSTPIRIALDDVLSDEFTLEQVMP